MKEVGEIVIICMSVLMVIKMNLSRTFLVTVETLDEFSVYEDLIFEDLMIIARASFWSPFCITAKNAEGLTWVGFFQTQI